MTIKPPIPFQRDWLTEAAKMIDGDSSKNLKLGHLKAVWEEYKQTGLELQRLRDILKSIVDAAQADRIARGLPPAPLPPMGPIVGVNP